MIGLNSVALFLLVSCSAVLYLEATLTCPPGQTLYEKRCYKTYRPSSECSKDFSFDDANAFCIANGGVMASIHNQTQNNFITSLIRKDQKNLQKKCGCSSAKKDYFYWIGLQLDHSPNQSVSSASWTDKSPLDYGNPLGAVFRPPFAEGHPKGSFEDGGDDSAVCPGGNQKKCVQIYGFGPTKGLWTDKRCNDTHTIEHKCSCDEEESNNNSTTTHTTTQNKVDSSANDFPQPDKCRDEDALNGFICQYCPEGWTYFEGTCYIAVPNVVNPSQSVAACTGLNSKVVSIHSPAENAFVNALAIKSITGTAIYIGLQLTHTNNLANAPVNSAAWSDGTPVNYGNPMVAPWSTRGTFPWAPAEGLGLSYPAQPDNLPPPGNCVCQWLPASGHAIGTWDDVNCPQLIVSGTVCKL